MRGTRRQHITPSPSPRVTAVSYTHLDVYKRQVQDSGAVLLSDEGRRKFLKTWQERKRDTLTHPYLGEKLSWGMVPYVQALLLARCLRGDLDGYPPFLWK